MRLLLTMTVAATFAVAGAAAAQQPQSATRADSTHAAHRTTTHHATGHARHAATSRAKTPTRTAKSNRTHATRASLAHASPPANPGAHRLPQPLGRITADAARTIALRHIGSGASVSKVTLVREGGREVWEVRYLTPRLVGTETLRIDARSGDVLTPSETRMSRSLTETARSTSATRANRTAASHRRASAHRAAATTHRSKASHAGTAKHRTTRRGTTTRRTGDKTGAGTTKTSTPASVLGRPSSGATASPATPKYTPPTVLGRPTTVRH